MATKIAVKDRRTNLTWKVIGTVDRALPPIEDIPQWVRDDYASRPKGTGTGYVTFRGMAMSKITTIVQIAKSGKVALTINRMGEVIGYKLRS